MDISFGEYVGMAFLLGLLIWVLIMLPGLIANYIDRGKMAQLEANLKDIDDPNRRHDDGGNRRPEA